MRGETRLLAFTRHGHLCSRRVRDRLHRYLRRAGWAPIPAYGRRISGSLPGQPFHTRREGRPELGIGGHSGLAVPIGTEGSRVGLVPVPRFLRPGHRPEGPLRRPAGCAGDAARRAPPPAIQPSARVDPAPHWRKGAPGDRPPGRGARRGDGSCDEGPRDRRTIRTNSACGPARGTGSRNWTYQCMPLQKGLFWECPHRHRA